MDTPKLHVTAIIKLGKPTTWAVYGEDGRMVFGPELNHEDAHELVRRWNAYPELLKMLTEVADFWAGGDAPPELWEAITSTIAKATQP